MATDLGFFMEKWQQPTVSLPSFFGPSREIEPGKRLDGIVCGDVMAERTRRRAAHQVVKANSL